MVTLAEVQAERARREQERTQTTMRGAALAGNGSITIEDIRRERSRRASAARETAPSQGVTPIQRASTMLRGATLNLNDELGGATAAVIEGGRAALEGDLANIAPRARGAFDTQAARIRGLTEDYQRQQPVGAAADEIGGAFATGGLGLARQGASRVAAEAPTMIQQMRRAGATGAMYGYGYGFNDQGSLAERAQAGNRGGGVGALTGVLAPPIVTGASLAVQAAGRALPNVRVDPSRVGAFGGNLTMEWPSGPASPSGPVRRGVRLADRARLDSGALSSRAAEAPEQAAVVDLFGDAGVRQLRPIAQAPGRTGDAAAAVADQRFADAPDVIMGALRRHLQVGESRSQALARLEADYDMASLESFRPLWRTDVLPANRAALEQFLIPYADDPVFQEAVRRGEAIFARDVANGRITGSVDENFARWAHYVKLGLDSAAKFARTPQGGGASGAELAGIRQMRARIVGAMDDAIPGYREARARWGGLVDAEDALEMGAAWVRMLPDEVAASRAQMTPFEIEHARIGLADEIRRMTSGNVVGHRNVANALNGRDMQMAIANAFDTPEQAADFLGTVNDTNRLLRNAQAWGGGSQTQGNQAYEADGVAAAVADYGGDLISGRWGQAVNRAGRQVGNLITNNAVERSNNAFGEQLLRPATSEEGRAFVAELIRIMQQREATRAASDATSRAGAAITGQQTASRRD